MKPRSILITIGQSGGVYVRPGFTTRIGLGPVAITIYPFDFDVFLTWLLGRVREEPKEPKR